MSGDPGLTHAALLYPDAATLPALIQAAITDGLDRDESVLVALPATTLADVRKHWNHADGLADRKRLEWVDTSAVGRSPGYLLPGIMHMFARRQATGRIRMIGTPWRHDVTELEYPACMQHEAAVNAVLGDRDAMVVCPYHADVPGAVLRDVERTHEYLTRDGQTTASDAFAADQAALYGEFNLDLPAPPADVTSMTVTLHQLPAARHLVALVADQAGLSAERTTDAVLAINELATNTVQHGGGTGQMQLWTQDGTLVCQLTDTGEFTNWLAGRVPPDPIDISGGRGLIMVHQLCDLVRTYTGAHGTQVRIYVSG
jgi:anti-sigma regulatory factor (Ser/Thr protein kinase)